MNLMDMLYGGRADLENVGNSAARDIASTSPESRQRGWDAVKESSAGMLGRAGLNTAMGLGMGMPAGMAMESLVGGIASPTSMAGLVGNVANSTLGIGASPTASQKIAGMLAGPVAGMALGPVGGLLGGLFGKTIADLGFDAMDARSEETTRDDMEDRLGWGEGHSTYADTKEARNSKSVSMNENAARGLSMALQSMLDEAANRAKVAQYTAPTNYGWGTTDYGGTGNTYGGMGIGGPVGGFRAIDPGYGPNMGGFGGLGIGNPSSYGGGNNGIGSGLGGSRGIGGVSGADLGKGSESW